MASNYRELEEVDEQLSELQLTDRDADSKIFSSCSDHDCTQQTVSLPTMTAVSVIEVDRSSLTSYESLYEQDVNVSDSIRGLSLKYEIRVEMAKRLLLLRDFEIVIVCDDSGSMITTVDGTQRTRWDELCSIVKIVLEIGVMFDANGVDIYFLNRKTFRNVRDPQSVDEAFAARPRGYTPLVPVLDHIFQLPLSNRGRDKKLLVFVATDGEPTDENGNENIPDLKRIMCDKRQADTTYVSFLLCTDDLNCISYLNEWDQTMKNVDVTDDFNTETKKIKQCCGRNYRFSHGDYVIKALLGAVDPEIKALSKPKKRTNSSS